MTSFYLPREKIAFLKKLLTEFPMLTILDTEMMVARLKSFMDALSQIVKFLWALSLISSFILLLATITSSLDERKDEALLLRILGISQSTLLKILLLEFLMLGLLAGVVGAISANLGVFWFFQQIVNLSYHVNAGILFWLPVMGMALVGLGGCLGVRKVFLTPPMQLLAQQRN